MGETRDGVSRPAAARKGLAMPVCPYLRGPHLRLIARGDAPSETSAMGSDKVELDGFGSGSDRNKYRPHCCRTEKMQSKSRTRTRSLGSSDDTRFDAWCLPLTPDHRSIVCTRSQVTAESIWTMHASFQWSQTAESASFFTAALIPYEYT
jgi:hypothetical protein